MRSISGVSHDTAYFSWCLRSLACSESLGVPFGVSALVGTYVLQHLFTADEGPFLSYLLLGTALRSFMSMPQHSQPGGDVDTLHLGEAKSLKIRKRL